MQDHWMISSWPLFFTNKIHSPVYKEQFKAAECFHETNPEIKLIKPAEKYTFYTKLHCSS